jgi:hypothetical protein
MKSRIVEILAAHSYRRGKLVDGAVITHPQGRSYLRIEGEEYPPKFAEIFSQNAQLCPGCDRLPVTEAMVKEFNRQPSLISARVITLGENPLEKALAEAMGADADVTTAADAAEEKLTADPPSEAVDPWDSFDDYGVMQDVAKANGIAANLSKDALRVLFKSKKIAVPE